MGRDVSNMSDRVVDHSGDKKSASASNSLADGVEAEVAHHMADSTHVYEVVVGMVEVNGGSMGGKAEAEDEVAMLFSAGHLSHSIPSPSLIPSGYFPS